MIAIVGVLNIYDIVFAHNVPAYTATRKTPQVHATPGAESAPGVALALYPNRKPETVTGGGRCPEADTRREKYPYI